MQLTIQDGTLCILMPRKLIYAETINNSNVSSYLLTCGYRLSAAQAIAYGALQERHTTIALAQLVRLIAISSFNDDTLIDK